MLKYTFVFLLTLTFDFLCAQNVKLTPNSEVSILTLGPDHDNLYSSFWHSAIRVSDPDNGIDWVYDYGRFDFDNPNFYTDFAKGYLRYKIGVASYKRFKAAYIYFNRDIEEQVLDLSLNQKQQIYDYLQWNIKPENQYYFYDYYENNCATKIRDVFEDILGDSLVFNYATLKAEHSYRSLTDLCTKFKPWGDYGIDLALGSRIDQKVEPRDYMFLPEYVRKSFAEAKILSEDGFKPIVKEYRLVNRAFDQDISLPFFTPGVTFWALFILTLLLTVWQWRQDKKGLWVDIILFSVFGLLGIVLAGIWFFTDHQAASNNYNLIWAFPLHTLLAIVLATGKFNSLVKYYFIANSVLLAGLLLSWGFLPQDMHEANIPLVLVLITRSMFIVNRVR